MNVIRKHIGEKYASPYAAYATRNYAIVTKPEEKPKPKYRVRVPIIEQEEMVNDLNLKLSRSITLTHGTFWDRLDTSMEGVMRFLKKQKRKVEIESQSYLAERVEILGPNLAAAHFVVYRGGAVKFTNSDHFVKKEKGMNYAQKLPLAFDPDFVVEAIDASNLELHYEALLNFTNLPNLKSINFKNNPLFNNWYVDFLSSFVPTLEHLDISYCKGFTHRGFCCLYRFKNLKFLDVTGVSNDPEFLLAALTIEEELSPLIIDGIDLKKYEKKTEGESPASKETDLGVLQTSS